MSKPTTFNPPANPQGGQGAQPLGPRSGHAGEGRYPRAVPAQPVKGNPATPVHPLVYNPQEQIAWVYILTNKPNGTLYIGVTNSLSRRVHEHKQSLIPGFAQKYGLKTLVYFEGYPSHTQAIAREGAMKNWPCAWKIRRILETNPTWQDLYPELF